VVGGLDFALFLLLRFPWCGGEVRKSLCAMAASGRM